MHTPQATAQEPMFLILMALHTHDGVVITDRLGRITWINEGFSEICGYDLADIIGLKPGIVLQGPLTNQATVQRIRSAIAQRTHCTETILNYHKDGHPYWVSLHITPIIDIDGEVIRFVAIERVIQECHRPSSNQHTLAPALVSICTSCKRIHDEHELWIACETYIQEHTNLTFSHAICPDCSQILYPDLQQ